MLKFISFVCFTLLFVSQLSTVKSLSVDEAEDANLLVVKNILNNYIVEGLDVTVRYNIYNTGNLPALNVKLVDENFPVEKFEYVSGFNQAKWAKLSPSSNVSHVAVVRPRIVGPFNLTHATVTYFPNEKATKAQIGYSTEIGEVFIQRQRDYNRRFASHTLDWILFVIMAAPSIVFPYFLWYSSKSRYESNAKSAKKSN